MFTTNKYLQFLIVMSNWYLAWKEESFFFIPIPPFSLCTQINERFSK